MTLNKISLVALVVVLQATAAAPAQTTITQGGPTSAFVRYHLDASAQSFTSSSSIAVRLTATNVGSRTIIWHFDSGYCTEFKPTLRDQNGNVLLPDAVTNCSPLAHGLEVQPFRPGETRPVYDHRRGVDTSGQPGFLLLSHWGFQRSLPSGTYTLSFAASTSFLLDRATYTVPDAANVTNSVTFTVRG